MNETSHVGKVGLFVAVGLVLLMVLLLSFGKGLSLFTDSFAVSLRAKSVGGLKKNANVLLSGVPVGRVTGFDVAPDGKGVHIRVVIEERYRDRIHADAHFAIQQLGLLGDQYVEITPQENSGPLLRPGEVLQAEEPFSLQETARSAKDLLELGSATLRSINDAFARVERVLLSDEVLTNVTVGVENFRRISQKGSGMVDTLDRLLATNSTSITLSVSNLTQFSADVEKLAAGLNALFKTNRADFTRAIKNLETITQTLERLSSDVEAGKGAAGLVLRDPEFRANVSNLASNLQIFTLNLSQRSLLTTLLFKPKIPSEEEEKPTLERQEPPRSVYPGKTPSK